MNKIRVCAFLALVVFIGSVVTDMFSGFMDGWNEAGDQKDFHALPSVSLLVRADDTLPADTLISAAQDTPMYCNTSEVSVQGFRSTKWRWVSFLLFPAGLFALYGFYSVARLVLTATKGEVFVHKNVRRMRIFVYALISVSLLFELQQWGIYHDLASQVRLEGYEVLPYSFKYAWFNYMLLALFTEIFAIGVKIKEEQDLTVYCGGRIMKKISILGILAILVIVAEFTYAMIAGWVDMKNSFLEGYNSVNVHSGTPQPEYSGLFDKVYVDVRPLETTAVDSLTNRFADKSVPYQVKRIGTVIVPTVWSSIVNFFAMFAIIPFFVGIYCLIRLLVSISKREVFTSDNVARLRFFTYSFAALYGLMTLHDWLNHLEAVKQVALLGYEVVASHDTDFTSLVIIILFTEIFAAGVKIKEEQDLTI